MTRVIGKRVCAIMVGSMFGATVLCGAASAQNGNAQHGSPARGMPARHHAPMPGCDSYLGRCHDSR